MSANLQEAVSRHQLEAVLPEYCILRWHHALLCAVYATLFLFFSYLPVSNWRTWNDVRVGSLGQDVANLVPLSEGIRHFEIGQGGSWVIAKIHQIGGVELLSLTFAFVQLATLACWSLVFYRLTNKWWSTFGSLVLGIGCIASLDGLTGQTFGLLAFALLALVLVSRLPSMDTELSGDIEEPAWSSARTLDWIGISVLFCLWANLDASFVIGLALMVCFALARAIELAVQHGVKAALADHEFQKRVWVLELAALTTLLNPQGIGLWKSLFWWPDNPFVRSFGGWSPTTMASIAGVLVFSSWAVFAAISRTRKPPAFWMITLIGLTVAVAVCSSMIVWFAPLSVAAIFAVYGRQPQPTSHPADTPNDESQRPLRFVYSLLTCLVIWFAFSFSPWGSMLLGGKSRQESQLIGPRMPIAARDYLR
ncbi:MAG: hypothetical protein KDB00_18935, partial [Planctomycetales bacterium]|nr:hypothetical protein [Planctomycetales bacterium]